MGRKKFMSGEQLHQINRLWDELAAAEGAYREACLHRHINLGGCRVDYESRHTSFLSAMAVLRSHIRRTVRDLKALGVYDVTPLVGWMMEKEVWAIFG